MTCIDIYFFLLNRKGIEIKIIKIGSTEINIQGRLSFSISSNLNLCFPYPSPKLLAFFNFVYEFFYRRVYWLKR